MYPKFSVTLDAADPLALGEFWAVALEYVREPPPAPYQTWDEALAGLGLPPERWNDANAIIDPEGLSPRIFIQKVPESKVAKNRVHLDVRVSTSPENKDMAAMQAKADQLVAAGATQIEVFDDEATGHWIVMQDPEGNEFCII